ncbi:MAG: hypothetical protein HY831_02265 [Candidatus Aenigmarchaeota archaeon]|nr:hypothetical protein [Candidatus Aenigmarchaeota archaeon]
MKLVYRIEPAKKKAATLSESQEVEVYELVDSPQQVIEDYTEKTQAVPSYVQEAPIQQLASPPVRNYTPPTKTIDRRRVSDSRVFKQTREAVRDVLEEAPHKIEVEERERIMESYAQRERSKGLHHELAPRAGEKNYYRRIVDVRGNPIGTVISEDNPNGNIVIGDCRYVQDANFDINRTKSEVYCIRASVYFSEHGYEFIERFVENLLVRRCADIRPRGGMDKYIEREMRIKNTFDTSINGLDLHISLRGRLQLFSIFDGLENMLVDDEELDDTQIRRFRANTHSATVKKWIYETTPELNSFIGELFKELSSAVTAVLV